MIAFADPVPDATEIAETLTGRTYLSWSAVSTFLRCPLKYKFHYCDQLPEEFVSSNLIFGSAVHAGLEVFFREKLATGNSLGIDAQRDLVPKRSGIDIGWIHSVGTNFVTSPPDATVLRRQEMVCCYEKL